MSGPDGFARSTQVEALGDGRYAADVAEGWDIGGNANGGYLLALVGRALAHATGRPDPITVTGHYLRPAHPGPATITTSVIKTGRRLATAHATLAAGDKALLTVLGTYGDLSAAEDGGPAWSDRLPPELPARARWSCAIRADGGVVRQSRRGPPPSRRRRVHHRWSQIGQPLIRGWFRLRDGEAMDTIARCCWRPTRSRPRSSTPSCPWPGRRRSS